METNRMHLVFEKLCNFISNSAIICILRIYNLHIYDTEILHMSINYILGISCTLSYLPNHSNYILFFYIKENIPLMKAILHVKFSMSVQNYIFKFRSIFYKCPVYYNIIKTRCIHIDTQAFTNTGMHTHT